MADTLEDSARRRLPVVGRVVTTTCYSPDVLAGIAHEEAAALAPLVGKDVNGAVEAAVLAATHAEQRVATAMHEEPPQSPIACARGCSTCCQAKVLVIAPEVLRIGEFLRKNKSPEQWTTLVEEVRRVDAITHGLSRADRADAHVPCPLLDADGGCSIHEVRPLVCRSWTSYDASACHSYWQAPRGNLTPPQWPVGYEVAQAVLAGLGKACLDGGLDGVPLEFIAALRIVLERPTAGERWSKKLPVFMAARDREWAEANGRV